ncbi:hypothetical protein DEA8626_00192 [Defluviimonas aquaemixtae]|uniref:DUF3857 domain-containing protein n=1 Tax=Albidovulum aquaemixtae TaxID=1542388 RepID=A0A2R8B218_9RHOB|nr:DUF3857 domain-containing protein [Defluviimonas aquaemixtae]SPH16681.1 hypothetical protein DEA8626_00192 [Defluviimonas aquaemixtae]
MRLILTAATLLFLALPALAQQLLRADAPLWVTSTEIPEAVPELLRASRGGVYYQLIDTQVAWDGDTRLKHFRLVTQVTDRAGLEGAATVSSDFDPAFETLTLTRLDVHRDGRTISYRDTLQSEVFRRETRLEAGIIDGTLTAHLQIPDLRVGDIVDAAFLHRREPVLEGANRAASSRLEYSVPVGMTRHVAYWPADWPFHAAPLPDRVIHAETRVGDTVRLEWRRNGHLPPLDEELTPVEGDPDAILQYGTWADWSPLAAALAPYYSADYPLPPAWEKRVAAIRVEHPGDMARASAALRLVQDEIRYVGIEVGAGGYFARPPMTVTTQGFGDCKDKTLLLRVLLSRLGIEAHPALADIDRGYALPKTQPAVTAFDHMILRVDIGGTSYWVDPTGSHEGGSIDIAPPPDYGFALPLTGPDQRILEPIDLSGSPGWQGQTTERFNFTLLGVFLSVTSEFRGTFANARRYVWATEPHDEISRRYLQFYARRYPGIRQVMPVTLEDDREANLVRMEERYMIPAPALMEDRLREDFLFAAEDFGNYYPDVQASPRQTPLSIGGPKRHRHVVKVTGAPINFNPPDRVEIENPAFSYSFAGRAPEDGQLEMEWVFETRDRLIAPGAVAEVIRDAARIRDSVGFSWDLAPE